jgi:hypothetical protein
LQATPPSCIAGFRAKAVHGAKWRNGVEWSLRCACGSGSGAVLAYPLSSLDATFRGEEFWVSPMRLRCEQCSKVTEIIDTARHGYDAQLAAISGRKHGGGYRGSGDPTAVHCPRCGAVNCSVRARFSHPHLDLFEDEPQLRPRAQEFFDVFTLRAKCCGCGEDWKVTSFELA